MRPLLSTACLGVLLTLARPLGAAPPPVELDATLDAAVVIGHPPLNELSGLAASAVHPGVFWAHNDSGAEPRLFAVTAAGEVLVPEYLSARYTTGFGFLRQAWPGIELLGATLHDWEDITRSGDVLYIADVGNNGNARRDLGIWVVPEPDPRALAQLRPAAFLPVHYPEQTAWPGELWEFDAEALFADGDRLYLITKHREAGSPFRLSSGARLYRIDPGDPARPIPLQLISRRDDLSLVTAAELSPDGDLLAVLSYPAVWLFPRPDAGDDWLSTRPWRIALPTARTRLAEALAWAAPDRLLIGNESGELFMLKLDLTRFVDPQGAPP